MEDFNSYLHSSKLMVLNLKNIEDRIKAVLWIEKLQDPSCGTLRQRHTYLKMLNVALEKHQLFPPFNLKPSHCCKLFVLPNEILKNISSDKGVEWFIDFHKFHSSRKKNYLNRKMHSEYVVIEDYPTYNNHFESNTKTKQTDIRVRGGGFPDKNVTDNLKDADNSDKSIECGRVDQGTDTASLADYCTPKRPHSFDSNQHSCPDRPAKYRGVAEMKKYSTPVYEPIPTPVSPDTPAYTVLPDLGGPMILAYDQLRPSPQLHSNVIYQPLASPVFTPAHHVSEQRSGYDGRYTTSPEFSSNHRTSRLGYYSSSNMQPVNVPVYSPPRTIPRRILNDPNISTAETRYRSMNIPMPRPIIKQDSPAYYSIGPVFDRTQSPYGNTTQQPYYGEISSPEERRTYVVSEPRPELLNPMMTRYEEFLQVPRQQQFDRTYYFSQMQANNRVPSSRNHTWFDLPSHEPPLHESTDYELSTYPNISQLSDSVFMRATPANTTYTIGRPETPAAYTSLSSSHLRSPANIPSNYDAFVIDNSIMSSTPKQQQREIGARATRLGDTYPVNNNVTFEELTKSSGCGKDKSCQKSKNLDYGCSYKCPCEQSFKERSSDFTGILNASCPEGCDIDTNVEKCPASTSKQNASFRDRVIAQQIDFYKDSVRICDNIENCSGSSKKCRQDIICRFASGGLNKQPTKTERVAENEFVDKPVDFESAYVEKRKEMAQSNSNVIDIVSLTELNKFHRPLILIRSAKDQIDYIPCIRITKKSDGPNVERWRTIPMKILEKISNDFSSNFMKDRSTNKSGNDVENEPIKLTKTTS